MRMLLVGDWRWFHYEEAFEYGLQQNGIDVLRFDQNCFFKGLLGRFQAVLPFPGPALIQLNLSLIHHVAIKRPDVVFFWRPTHILPLTVRLINYFTKITVSYNNDDPFGHGVHDLAPWHHHWLWFWYLRCLPLFSKNFFYRHCNILEAKNIGAVHAGILMSYFIPSRNRPLHLTLADQLTFGADVVYVGHYEPDGRDTALQELIDAKFNIRVWGGSTWNNSFLNSPSSTLYPIRPANGEDYLKALCGAKICLAFLSKLNRDNYTRRCFEIPASGCLMLAERTEFLQQLFVEDHEAVFFSSVSELMSKVRWLLSEPLTRQRIAISGMRRVWSDQHDVVSRARNFLSDLNS